MNRTDFIHLKKVFPSGLLAELREKLRSGFEAEKIINPQGVGGVELRFDPAWYEPWKQFPGTGLLDGYAMVNFPPQVRWVREQRHLVPWHQDIAYVGKLGQVLTCFVPLDDEPWKHSTLEFSEAAAQIEHELEDVYGGLKMEPKSARRTYFQLELGDCLLFGDLAPHRTFVPMDATLERFSFEYRLSRPDKLVAGKDYFDIRSSLMVKG